MPAPLAPQAPFDASLVDPENVDFLRQLASQESNNGKSKGNPKDASGKVVGSAAGLFQMEPDTFRTAAKLGGMEQTWASYLALPNAEISKKLETDDDLATSAANLLARHYRKLSNGDQRKMAAWWLRPGSDPNDNSIENADGLGTTVKDYVDAFDNGLKTLPKLQPAVPDNPPMPAIKGVGEQGLGYGLDQLADGLRGLTKYGSALSHVAFTPSAGNEDVTADFQRALADPSFTKNPPTIQEGLGAAMQGASGGLVRPLDPYTRQVSGAGQVPTTGSGVGDFLSQLLGATAGMGPIAGMAGEAPAAATQAPSFLGAVGKGVLGGLGLGAPFMQDNPQQSVGQQASSMGQQAALNGTVGGALGAGDDLLHGLLTPRYGAGLNDAMGSVANEMAGPRPPVVQTGLADSARVGNASSYIQDLIAKGTKLPDNSGPITGAPDVDLESVDVPTKRAPAPGPATLLSDEFAPTEAPSLAGTSPHSPTQAGNAAAADSMLAENSALQPGGGAPKNPYARSTPFDAFRNSAIGKYMGLDDLSQHKALVQQKLQTSLRALNQLKSADPAVIDAAKSAIIKDHYDQLDKLDPTLRPEDKKAWLDGAQLYSDFFTRNMSRLRGMKFVTSLKSQTTDLPIHLLSNALTMTDPTAAYRPAALGGIGPKDMALAAKYGAIPMESLGHVESGAGPGQLGAPGKVADAAINMLGKPSDTLLARQRAAGFRSEYNRFLKQGYSPDEAGPLAAQRVDRFYQSYPTSPKTQFWLNVDKTTGAKPGTSAQYANHPLVRGFVQGSMAWQSNIGKILTNALTDSPRTAATLAVFVGTGAAGTHGAFMGVSLKDREAALAKLPPTDRWQARIAGVPYRDDKGAVKFRDGSSYMGIFDMLSDHHFDPAMSLEDKTKALMKDEGKAFFSHGMLSNLIDNRPENPAKPDFEDSTLNLVHNLGAGKADQNDLYDLLSTDPGRLFGPPDLHAALGLARNRAFDNPGEATWQRGLADYFAPQISDKSEIWSPLEIRNEMNQDKSAIHGIYNPNKGGLNEKPDNQQRMAEKYLQKIDTRAKQMDEGDDSTP